MRTMRSGCVSQVASCCECDWQYENQKNALALAAKHADATGHEVSVEIVNSVRYNGKTVPRKP